MIATQAWPLVLVPLCAGVAAVAVGLDMPGWLLIAAGSGALYLFRDPPRTCTQEPEMLCAPVDGRVMAMDRSPEPLATEGLPTRLRLRLSLFDVRVSRAVLDGELVSSSVHRHRFWAAMTEDRVMIWQGARGRVGLRQQLVVDRAAPRLYTEPCSRVRRGDRLGVIGCSSTVELYLPANAQLLVRPGDRLRAGETELARWVETGAS